MFYSGQKVVCVDDSPSVYGDESGLVKGDIYTVNKVMYSAEADRTCLDIVEVPNDWDNSWYWGFRPERFRPVTEKKTDISVFKEIVTKVPQTKVTEDA